MGTERYSLTSVACGDNSIALSEIDESEEIVGGSRIILSSPNPCCARLILKDAQLFVDDVQESNRIILLTPARKCPHGVAISSSQRQLSVREAAVSSETCVFIDYDYRLWSFPLTVVDRTVEVDAVHLLQTRRVKKICCGSSHYIALVEEIEASELRNFSESEEKPKRDDECPKCLEDRRLRLSTLRLEADKKAQELELACDRWEIESIASSASLIQSQRRQMSEEKRNSSICIRPHSLPALQESLTILPSSSRSITSMNPGEVNLSFLSLDNIELDEKLREYEKQSDVVHSPKREAADMEVQKLYEVFVWGNNDEGQLGLGDTLFRKWPTRLVSLNHSIMDVSCGSNHSSAITVTGEVYFWGQNISHINDDNNYFTRPKLLKLGPEQFVFRQHSTADITWLLLVGREITTSLYRCGPFSGATRAVTRIPQTDKSKIFVNVCEKNGLQLLQVDNTPLVRQVLVLFFRGCLLSRLLKGITDIFNSTCSSFSSDFAVGEHITIIRDLCNCSNAFFKVVYSALFKIRNRLSKLSKHGLVDCYSIFSTDTFLSSCTDFLMKYCAFEAYDSISICKISDNLEKMLERLSLEFGVEATTTQMTIKNLIAEVLQFLTFLTTKARDSLEELENESLVSTQKKSLSKWRKTNGFLQRTLAAAKMTRKEAWTNPRLSLFRKPGRLLLGVFPVGEDKEIKSTTFEQPRFLIQPKISAIYVFEDFLVIEEARGYKSYTRSYPLHLIWIDRHQDSIVTLKSPEIHLLLEFSDDPSWFVSCCSYWSDPFMEGSPVPSIRKGSYEFSVDSPKEHLRQKRYTGQWKNGHLCGKGKLEDLANGDVCDGVFESDRLHGFGQMFQSVPSDGSSSFYVESASTPQNFYRGIFLNGLLNGLAKIRYSDGSSYDGYVKSGKSHGFGVRKRGHSTHLGEFRDGLETGYGVLINNKEKRLGEFLDGKLNGKGTIVTIDGCVFEGEWVSDKMKRGKILTAPTDGTDPLEYEGETDTGDRLGDIGKTGRLRVSRNMYLQGSFSGNILRGDIRIIDASLSSTTTALSPVRSMLCGPGPCLSEWSVPVHLRWTQMFDIFKQEELGYLNVTPADAWSKIVKGMVEGKQLVHGDVSTGFCDALERIPDYSAEWSSEYYHKTAEYWRLAQDNIYHPLRRILNGITEVLTASYSDISAHRMMYDHCVLEARHLIEETYRTVRILFPSLPEDPWDHSPISFDSPETDSSPNSSPEKQSYKKSFINVPVPCCDFICESFFGRCSPILFTIYLLHNKEREERYWGKAVYLNAHTDVKLLTHLGVEREVWPIAISSEKTRDLDRPIIVTTARDKFYRRAVDSLQRLPSETNPSAKLRILTDTYTIMEQCIVEQTEIGTKHVFSADSLLPAFIYVVIRAQIRHLGTEILCLDDFSRDWRGDGAIGLLFTILQSAYLFICNEKSLV